MKPTAYIASFDSASGMLRALGRLLHGRDFPALGLLPDAVAPLVERAIGAVNRLPRGVLETVYIYGGWHEAIRPAMLARVRTEDMARWVVEQYPRRSYPAALIGSSTGAAVHLGAALGIPWLPQTFLIPVRHNHVHPDEPRYALEAFRDAGRTLLAANPDLQLHHMHDANQDRLMIQRMTYFRVKQRRLARAYERVAFDRPEAPSPLVADLYRWWYAARGVPAARLLVSCFLVLEPWWTLRTGSVPFWMTFAVEDAAAWLSRYLDEAEPYDELGLMLFSHGVESAGWVPIEGWRRLLARVRRGFFVGVDPAAFPRDFASFARSHAAVQALPTRVPAVAPLTLAELAAFLDKHGHRYPVRRESLEPRAA